MNWDARGGGTWKRSSTLLVRMNISIICCFGWFVPDECVVNKAIRDLGIYCREFDTFCLYVCFHRAWGISVRLLIYICCPSAQQLQTGCGKGNYVLPCHIATIMLEMKKQESVNIHSSGF